MLSPVYTVKFAGPAGAGIKSSGLLFSKILLSFGYNLRDYSEYPSLVRGGHNTYQVSFSTEEIFAPHFNIDLFFSFAAGHWQSHQSELTKAIVFTDNDGQTNLPLKELSTSLGSSIYSNTICLGVASYLLNLDFAHTSTIISQHFGTDSPNNAAFKIGYDYAQNNFSTLRLIYKSYFLPHKSKQEIYDGNEAYSWGFIAAGGNLFAAYPMTPATGALHFLAQKQIEKNLVVVHPEDEIAAASIVCGAAYAGARAATATSGGGFALMTESVSLAGAAELGVVFYLVSRPGPATGLPTWTGQSDLLFAINAGHGEFNKIVIAPGDQQESFDFSADALNLAAKYQVPVILLSDKYIGESSASLPDLSTKKVKIVSSAKAIPGTPEKEFLANSYEHGPDGFSTEDIEVIKTSVENRLKLGKTIIKNLPKPNFYGLPTAKKLIVSWGSPKSVILEALRLLPNASDYAFLQITSLWPINPELELLIKPFKDIIVIENNSTSPLTQLLKSQFDFHPTQTILKYDGRPFFPEELIVKLKIGN